jgi:hypothetical protein
MRSEVRGQIAEVRLHRKVAGSAAQSAEPLSSRPKRRRSQAQWRDLALFPQRQVVLEGQAETFTFAI